MEVRQIVRKVFFTDFRIIIRLVLLVTLNCSDTFFLQRLQAKVIKIVDVSYGGENGFNQAIELSADSLANVKFIQEKKLIGNAIYCWKLLR